MGKDKQDKDMKEGRRKKEKGMGLLFASLFAILFSFFLLPSSVEASLIPKVPNNLGLVAYYSFEDGDGTKATDFSGNGNTGDLTNMETSDWVVGKTGTALEFDGSSEVVVFPSKGLGTEYSVSAWVNSNDFSQNSQGIVGWDGNLFPMYLSGSGTIRHYEPTNGYTVSNSVSSLAGGSWHHFVVTRNGATVTFYVDGANHGGATAGATGSSMSVRSIGALQTNGSFPFDGKLDEVRIYNRMLAPSEVAALYDRSGISKRVQGREADLIGWWKLDDGSGTKAGDSSGNGNTGDLTNMEAGDWGVGKFGSALTFDGTNESVEFSLLSTAVRNVSMSAWFRTTDYTADRQTIFYNGSGGTNGYGLFINNEGESAGNLRVLYGGVAWFDTGVDIADSDWHHVALTLSDDATPVKRVYLDGSQIWTNSASVPNTPGTGTAIGNDQSGTNTPFFKGQLDEVRFYGTELNAAEILKLYNTGSHRLNAGRQDLFTNGLVGLWSFNGPDLSTTTSTDRSGQGNDGVINGSPTPDAGKTGQALRFSNDYIAIPSTAELAGGHDLTISAWIYPTDLSGTAAIAMKWEDSDDKDWGLFVYQSSLGFEWETNGTGQLGGVSTPDLSINTWYHVAAVYDHSAKRIRLYTDGVEVFDETEATGTAQTSTQVTIGKTVSAGYNQWPFKGLIDEVRVYNRALSVDEVLQLYNMAR